MPGASGAVFPRAITISRNDNFKFSPFFSSISSGLSSERIILSPFTKEFRGEGHSYESLNFSGATNVADYYILSLELNVEKFQISSFLAIWIL